MNYDDHVLAGILTYPIAVLVISLLGYYGLPIEASLMATALGYGFYVLGSDLPDMDHPNSLIHRGTKPLVAVVVGISAFRNLYVHVNVTPEWANVTLIWAIAALIALASWNIFTKLMPKHRGIVHTLAFAFLYAAFAFLVVDYGFDMRFGEALFVGLSSFSGYVLHLILDKSLKLK